MRVNNLKDVGPPNVPQEVKRLRREAGDLLRRYGQPVAHFHLWNLDDVEAGLAKECPACFDETYNQARGDCTVCFGQGFVSVLDSPDQYINDRGRPTTVVTAVRAPAFGGYAEPIITWLIEPDVGVDTFRINDQGVLVKTENAQGIAYFTPTMGDNDLVINVHLAEDSYTVRDKTTRYLLKETTPQTVRGWGKKAHTRAYPVGQAFEMSRLPSNTIYYKVPLATDFGAL